MNGHLPRHACTALALVIAATLAPAAHADTIGFVERVGTHFEAAGQPIYYVGASYYNAMNQAADPDPAERLALDASFARLASLGVTNVRIWASSEGLGGPTKLTPTVQPYPGDYSETMLQGLDYAVKSAKDHGLRAVLVLTNSWDWSGGMNQYVAWSPNTVETPPNYSWGQGPYHDQFYTDAAAQNYYTTYVNMLVNRRNTAYAGGSGPLYKDDPTIFSWELANEPRCYEPPGGQDAQTVITNWIHWTAAFIKAIDPNHMVAAGSEGFLNVSGSSNWWERPEYSGTDFLLNHQSANIDYTTTHIWPANWSWYPDGPKNDPSIHNMEDLYNRCTQFLIDHINAAQALGKPLVLEEFGLLRDNDHDANGLPGGATTTERDELFRRYFNILYASARTGGAAAGSNFWTYNGDPPQEAESLYSIYDPSDNSTLNVIRAAAALMNSLVPARGDADGDGKVDGGDLAVWQQNYDPRGVNANTWAMGDWNADGRIDGSDLALWQQNYNPRGLSIFDNGSGDSLDGTEIPEPGTFHLTLLAISGIILPLRRVRRNITS